VYALHIRCWSWAVCTTSYVYTQHTRAQEFKTLMLDRIAAHSTSLLDAGYCYRRRDVAWSVCLFVCWSQPWTVQNGWTARDAVWKQTRVGPWTIIRRGWTSSPHGKCDGSICVVAMRAVAIFTVATCSSCRHPLICIRVLQLFGFKVFPDILFIWSLTYTSIS